MGNKEVKNKHVQKSINVALSCILLKPGPSRPGYIIEHLPEEHKRNLQNLKLKDIAQIPEWMEAKGQRSSAR